MVKSLRKTTGWIAGVLSLGGLLLAGCGKSNETGEMPAPENPEEAATQVEQVFVSAPPELQRAVQDASDGLREADFEKAAMSLQAIRLSEQLTFEQGMAVHNSMVALEKEIVAAMQAGDPQAKQAYERLKRMKRN